MIPYLHYARWQVYCLNFSLFIPVRAAIINARGKLQIRIDFDISAIQSHKMLVLKFHDTLGRVQQSSCQAHFGY